MTNYECPACGWMGDHINQTHRQDRIDDDGNSYSVELCPECPEDVELDRAGGWRRADPAELAEFDPTTKVCVMNCGAHVDDPRSPVERMFLCGDCETMKVVNDRETLANTIGIWRYKGREPLAQLQCFTYTDHDGNKLYAFGIRDYVDDERYIFESDKKYKTRAAAIAAIGRALDREAEQ